MEHTANLFRRMQKHAGIQAVNGEGYNEKHQAGKHFQIEAHTAGSDNAPPDHRDPVDSGERQNIHRQNGGRCPPCRRCIVLAEGDGRRYCKNRLITEISRANWISAHADIGDTADAALSLVHAEYSECIEYISYFCGVEGSLRIASLSFRDVRESWRP